MGSSTSEFPLHVRAHNGDNIFCVANTLPTLSSPTTHPLPEHAGHSKSDKFTTWVLHVSAATTASSSLPYLAHRNNTTTTQHLPVSRSDTTPADATCPSTSTSSTSSPIPDIPKASRPGEPTDCTTTPTPPFPSTKSHGRRRSSSFTASRSCPCSTETPEPGVVTTSRPDSRQADFRIFFTLASDGTGFREIACTPG